MAPHSIRACRLRRGAGARWTARPPGFSVPRIGVRAAGVVVGGVPRTVESATMEVFQRAGDIGLQAAATGDPVLVCVSGLCVVVADGAISVGASLKLSTATSGRVTTATVATDAGKILGKAWDAAAANGDKIRALVALA